MGSEVKVKVTLQSGVQAGLNKIKSQFSEFRRSINGEIGNLLAGGSIVAGIESLVEKGSKLQDLGERFDVPVEALQRLGNAASLNGATLDDVAAAYNKLTINAEKARQGSDDLRAQFEKLGVSMQDVVTLSPEQLFLKISDGVANASNRTEAYNAVVATLGKSSGVLFSTLEGGSESIKKVGDSMGVLDAKTVESLDSIGDRITILKNRVFVFGGGILSFFQKVAESLGVIAGTAVNNIERMVGALGDAGGVLKNLLAGNFSAAKESAKQLLGNLANGGDVFGTKGLVKDLADVWQGKIEPEAKKEKRKGPLPDIEDTGEEKAKATRIEELEKKLADMRAKSVTDQLDGEAKINALIAQRADILARAAAAEKSGNKEESLKLQVQAQETQKEIDAAKKQQEKAVSDAQDAFDKAQRQAQFAGLKTNEQRREFLKGEIERLQGLIDSETDAAEKLKLQTEQTQIEQKLGELDKKTQAPQVAANSLRRLGGQTEGGFNGGVAGDKLLTEQKEHKQLLKDIKQGIKDLGNGQLLLR